jgi:hypothetical protein
MAPLVRISAPFAMSNLDDIRRLGLQHRNFSSRSADLRPWCNDDEEGSSSR